MRPMGGDVGYVRMEARDTNVHWEPALRVCPDDGRSTVKLSQRTSIAGTGALKLMAPISMSRNGVAPWLASVKSRSKVFAPICGCGRPD